MEKDSRALDLNREDGSPAAVTPTADVAERLLSANFILVCAASFLFSGSMLLLLAVLPLYVTQELHGSESQVGLVAGVFTVAAVLARPLSGRLVDEWSRKAGLSLGAFLFALSPALFAWATSVPMLLGIRFLHGIGIAAYTTGAGTLVADISPANRRGEAMGYFGVALNLAMAIGPALGALLLPTLGFVQLFWLSAAVAGGSFLLTLRLSEPPRPPRHERVPLVSREALFPALIMVSTTVTFGAVVSFLPLLVFAKNLGNPGLFFTVYSVGLLISRAGAGKLSDLFGRTVVILPGMMLIAVAMGVLAFTTSLSHLLIAAVLHGFGYGGVQPTLLALAVDRASPQARGVALATVMGAIDVGIGISSIGLGLVLEWSGFTWTYLGAGMVVLIGALMFAVVTFRQGDTHNLPGHGKL
jgi:MFS family permease